MFDSFLAQMLVLLLLIISGLRVFFISNPRVDSIAILPTFAFGISLLLFFVWGVQVQSILIFAVALIFFVTNIRSLFRLSEELIVDDYSISFKIFTFLELLLAIAAAAFVIFTRPVRAVPKDFGVTKRTVALGGNFSSGFHILRKISLYRGEKGTGTLTIYSPEEKIVWKNDGSIFNSLNSDDIFVEVVEFDKNKPAEENLENLQIPQENETKDSEENQEIAEEIENEYVDLPLILFVGTAHAPSSCFEPYFLFLAQKGFTVLAADFFSSDTLFFEGIQGSRVFRRIAILSRLISDEVPASEKDRIRALEFEQTKNGFECLASISESEFPDSSVFFITEGFNLDTIQEIAKNYDGRFAGFFSLNRIDEYKAPTYGFIEQTDILLAKILGIERDSAFFIPRYAAFKTIQTLNSIFAKQK